MVASAHHICQLLGEGTSKPDAAMQASNGLGIGMAEATLLVDVASANLCKTPGR
ncbi:DUF732 domain-containing protein [Candidatus Mycobacterium wuenschmannii]|uniref:DUF732 domain-containing protein n=1 Tax=Candidatus Mycobacterium wuenschmannii TaxID=3027808 RepID=UPI0036F40DA4